MEDLVAVVAHVKKLMKILFLFIEMEVEVTELKVSISCQRYCIS